MSERMTGAVAVFGVTTCFSPIQKYTGEVQNRRPAVWALQGRDPDSLRRA